MNISSLLNELQKTPEGPFFNPWFDQDSNHDRNSEGPDIRKKQFRNYLEERLSTARYLCVAEALGYQGGHFTGIAMTSERILLGYQKEKHGIDPESVLSSIKPERTSRPDLNPKGMTEPTATIMWKALHQLRLDPRSVVLWNALAWHPYNPVKGLLSNRTPTNLELEYGLPALKAFLRLFPKRQVIAVGKKAEYCLNDIGIQFQSVRHPANGGAVTFRNQFQDIIQNKN